LTAGIAGFIMILLDMARNDNRGILEQVSTMGFVQKTSHDIFVSYARVDDVTGGTDAGWVTTFKRLLKIELDRKLGKVDACDIWMDHRLPIGSSLTDEIFAKVRTSAVLLVVLSKGYLNSFWCNQEVKLFLAEEATRRSKSPSAARVFVIETDRVEVPDELEDILRQRFWVANPDDPDETQLLGYPRPNYDVPGHTPFFTKFNSLVCDLAKALEDLSEAPYQPPRATIYLAQATEDLDEQHQGVRGYLLQQRFRVVPDGDYPKDEAGYRAAAKKDITDSALFVQLLGSLPGRKLAGSQQGYVAVQRKCAEDAKRQILSWRGKDLNVEAIAQTHAEHAKLLADSLTMGLEEFKAHIVNRLEIILKPSPPPSPKPDPAADVGKQIFVNADQSDLTLAEGLKSTLNDLGAWVKLTSDRDEKTDPGEYLAEQLGECDVLLMLYGTTTGKWIDRQLALARKAMAKLRKSSPIALFEAEPRPKADRLSLFPPRMKVVYTQPELIEYLKTL
jgi:TIR domain